MWNEFREFIARGNVIDLAVAVIMGAAFGKIVTTLVEGVLMPPLGLLLNKADFSSLFIVLGSYEPRPVSLAEAKARAIPVIAYGQLFNDAINFLLIAFAVFMLVRMVNHIKSKQETGEITTKDCPYCLSTIPLKASRCAHCTVDLQTA